jgi:hypothetical protein
MNCNWIPTSSYEIDEVWQDAKRDLVKMEYGELVLTFKVHQGKTLVEKKVTLPKRYEMRYVPGRLTIDITEPKHGD